MVFCGNPLETAFDPLGWERVSGAKKKLPSLCFVLLPGISSVEYILTVVLEVVLVRMSLPHRVFCLVGGGDALLNPADI